MDSRVFPVGLAFTTAFILSALSAAPQNVVQPKVHRVERSLAANAVSNIEGFVGRRFAANRNNYLRRFDIDHYVRLVEERKYRDWKWVGEHPGKWLETAALVAAESDDPALRKKAESVLGRLVAAQEPSGYLGVTDPEVRTDEMPLRGMDAYELYFMMHGLLTAHDLWGNEEALNAARRLANYFVEHIGPGKAEFWPGPKGQTISGHSIHYGLEGTLLADPMLRLYLETGDEKYLNWSRWVVDNIDRWSGSSTFSNLDRVAAGELGLHQIQPRVHAHTLQMNLLAFLRLYQITGDESLLRKVRGAWRDIAKRQTHITGGTSHDEYYRAGDDMPISGNAVETCGMMSWMELTEYLLELTADPAYADAIERLLWNHLFAAQTADGESFRYFTPLNGAKPAEYFHGPDCCTASGPRMVSKIPSLIYATGQGGVYVNQFIASTAKLTLDGGETVSLKQETDYPSDGKIAIEVEPSHPVRFTLNIRLPAWCRSPSLRVNGEDVKALRPGSYARLDREWKAGDLVVLSLPMSARWVKGSHTTERMWALTRGPVVYAVDTVLWNKQASEALGKVPKDMSKSIGLVVDESDPGADLEAAAVPVGALGPFFYVTVVLPNGEQMQVRSWPYANVGQWYADAAHKPAHDERRYAFAVWLPSATAR